MPQDENKTPADAEALADKQEKPEISEELKGEEISGEQEAAPALPAVEPIPEIPEPAKSAEQPTQTEQTETPAPAEQKREETPAVEPPVEQIPPESPQQPVADDLAPDLSSPSGASEIEEPSADSRPAPVIADKQPQVIEKIEITPQGRTSPVAPLRSAPPRGTTFSRDFIQNLLIKARAKIQERKRKKLDKIMALFVTKQQIANKDVRKLLHARKRTATNYLNILEREQKIIQVGKKGKGVSYIKKP